MRSTLLILISAMARWKLKPTLDKTTGLWRINIPPQLSASGKRQRLFFQKHWECLAASNKLRSFHDQFGFSAKMLNPSRMIEATECFQLLDEAAGRSVSPGSMREIIVKALQARKESSTSITLDELFNRYLERVKRQGKTGKYLKQLSYSRNVFDMFSDSKLPQISSGNIDFCIQKLSSGSRNAHLAILRGVMNFAVKQGWLSKSPVSRMEFLTRPKLEIKPLSNELVERMLRHSAEYDIELLPYLAIGFFCGCREAELSKILFSDVNMEDAHVMVRPEVSKTRRKRFPPIPPNALEWLKLYLSNRHPGVDLKPSDRILKAYTVATLRKARVRNYRAAGGTGQFPQNCKRITFATAFISAYGDIDRLATILGHTSAETSFAHYASNLPKSVALQYFDIRP